MNSVVAVASHSFPKNQILREELLRRYPGSKFNETRAPLAGTELVSFLQGHPKAITGLEVLDNSVFAALPALKVVSKYGVGLDTIDLVAAERHGVSVRWTPGVNRQSVAELTIAFMYAKTPTAATTATMMRALSGVDDFGPCGGGVPCDEGCDASRD